MNRSGILRPLRPLASVAVLALVTVGLQPTFVALPQAGSLSRVPTQVLFMPTNLRGTLVALHRAQRTGVLASANGSLFPLRFTSVAQERRLRVGSRLSVSGDARHHIRLLVRVVRTEGVSTRAHVRGIVARRLGRGAVEVLGVNGAAVVIHLGHARVTRVHHPAARFAPTLASAHSGPAIAPGEEIDTAVTLTGVGVVATGTATVTAPSPAQVEVEGVITAVNEAAGTLTIQDEDGPTTVVSVGAAASTYHVGQEVEVVGTATGAGGSTATVRAQFVTLEHAKAPTYATPLGAHVEVEGIITAVNMAAGTLTIQDEDGPSTVVSVGAAAGTYRVGQEVEVSGIVVSAGSNGATVQAQFIKLEESEAPEGPPAGAATIKVEGLITAVNAAAGTITIRDEDGPTTVVSMGAAAATYQVGQEVEVVGVPTGAGGSAATVRAQYVALEDAEAPRVATPVGAHVEVEGVITAVNPAAGTLTIQDEDGPSTVVAVGAAAGTYRVGQEVEVSGIVVSAGSNGATVQAQFIRLERPEGDDD